jgi:pimeloyl-ACP methyl ester carboxylesterase
MMDAGHDASCVLPDGRDLDFWDGGDPQGRAVVFHPGSPCTRVMGREGHEAALAAGVRLVSVSRPGYGGSTLPSGAPSLRATGADTAELARQLGLEEYAVLGASGGGPFAVATAVADPERVRALGLAAGTGPWRLLAPPTDDDADERALLALLDAGDLDGAWAGYRALLADQLGGLAALDDDARVDAFFAGSPISPDDYGTRPVWTANLREVTARLDGLAFDNLAWGGAWDVDPHEVGVRTALWYGEADVMVPPRDGQWLAEQVPAAVLTVYPGANHADVCSSHWAEQLRWLWA